jgi:hypothetical protein
MTSRLFESRCAHHPDREAAVKCPVCARFFCRECVTEHADRWICASCLRQQTTAATARPARFTPLWRGAQCLTGILLCWLIFQAWGRILLAIPSEFHEGNYWQAPEEPPP